MFNKIVGKPTDEEILQMVKEEKVLPKFKDPEAKEYIALICLDNEMDPIMPDVDCILRQLVEDNDTNSGVFVIRHGRRNMFEAIKKLLKIEESIDDMIEECGLQCVGHINLKHSTMMVEGLDVSQRSVDLYQFLRLCNNEYPEDAIDLEPYIKYLNINEEENEGPAATGFGNAGTLI